MINVGGGCWDRFKADFFDQCDAGYVLNVITMWSHLVPPGPRATIQDHMYVPDLSCLTSGTNVSLPVRCLGPQSHPGDRNQGSLGYPCPAQSVWPRSAGSRCPADDLTPPLASGSCSPAPAGGRTEPTGQDDGHTTATEKLREGRNRKQQEKWRFLG